MRIRTSVAAAIIFAALALGAGPWQGQLTPAAEAQNMGQRVVNGIVSDDSGHVSGATVFLRNGKTKAIRSYTSNKDGRFRFAQVNMSDEYDLWAEKDGKKSATKTISPWDSRKEMETELRLK